MHPAALLRELPAALALAVFVICTLGLCVGFSS
jgi:hypothetical protein